MKVNALGLYATPVFSGNLTKAEAQEKPQKRFPKKAAIVVGAAAAATIGLVIANKKGKLEPIKDGISKAIGSEKLSKKEEQTWLAIMALAGIGGYGTGKLTRKDTDEISQRIQSGDTPTQRAVGDVHQLKINRTNPTLYKYSKDFYGLPLLTQDNVLNRNVGKYNKALEHIQSVGYKKLTSELPLPVLNKEHPVIWSVTSEFAPVKEGGLGSVPPEIRNNATKLGIDMPTFVPMYLNDGTQGLRKLGDKYLYNYKGKEFNVEKAVTFKMDVFQDGKTKTIPVEMFVSEDSDNDGNKRKLVFVKCDSYFDGSIYEGNTKTEEPEKFAIMSKAVYELAKLTMDGESANRDLEINSPAALEKIKAPDGMILNDWHASPIAALMRYKAPMENAYGQVSDKTMNQLKDMRLITIGHNVMYQGSTRNNNDDAQRRTATANILNTLFDKYAYDIVRNARTQVEKIDPEDEGLQNLDNVLVMNEQNPWENHTNLLNMGIILSDYFCPVSKNYSEEIISDEHPELSYSLRWALVQKANADKLVGVINGNDFRTLSIEHKKGNIKKLTGLDFELYNKSTSKDGVIERKQNNKINMYNNFVLPYTESQYATAEQIEHAKECSPRLEFYKGIQGTDMPLLKDSELLETPILTSGGRLVSQKGVGILCDSLALLYKNWDKDFPSKPKPIVYIAGADGENGVQRAKIEKLKDKKLSKEDNDRVLFGHGWAPMDAMMAASDFFLMPSEFEPCGLTQGESMGLATPVIASAVGGIVDTVNRDNLENGILTKKGEPLTAQSFYEAIKEGLTIYFEDKDRYNDMVMDSLAEDFSWIQKGKKGPIYEYLELMGIPKENLKDVDTL